VGQKPDADYDPEAKYQFYYSRAERLALPNAPVPLKKGKNYLWLFLILSILLVVLILRGAGGNKNDPSAGTAEYRQGRYGYKLSGEARDGSLDARLIVRLQNNENFRLPPGIPARFSFEFAKTTNHAVAPLMQEGVDLPLHVFSARIPLGVWTKDTGTRVGIRAYYPGNAFIPAAELFLEYFLDR